MNEGGTQPAVREAQDRAEEELIRSPQPDMMADAIPPPSSDCDSLTQDYCLDRCQRPAGLPGACRVAGWRRTFELQSKL